jgi:hypothetical protein
LEASFAGNGAKSELNDELHTIPESPHDHVLM